MRSLPPVSSRRTYSFLVSDLGAGPVPTPRTLPTGVVLVVCALALGAVAWHIWAVPFGQQTYGLFQNGIDTRVYRGGALAVRFDQPLYDAPVYKAWQFTYTPFAALLMLPMAWISNAHAEQGMHIVNVICLLLLTFLSLRALGFRRDLRFWIVTAAFSVAVTTLEPVHTTIWNGQINLVLAVLVLGCLTLPLGRWRGIGVGLAAGIKLTPVFFVLYLALLRNWRAVITAIATVAATVVIGLLVLRGQAWHFWTSTMRDTSRIGPENWPPNQSIHGALIRLGTLGIWQAPGWLWLPIAALVAAAGLWAALRAYRCGQVLLAVTVTGLTSCGVSPFSWGHHWVWVAPLLLILVVQAVDAGRSSVRAAAGWWALTVAMAALTFCWYRSVYVGEVHRYAFGSFRLFWAVPAHGWHLVGAAIGSSAYPIVLIATIAVTLWWTRGADPIRFKTTERPEPELRD